MIRAWLTIAPLALIGCRSPGTEAPRVQDSAEGTEVVSVSLNRVTAGFYRAIQPSCIGRQYTLSTLDGSVQPAGGLPVRPGEIAEFRNYLPDVPTNITALDAPAPMFSPNLVRPYNIRSEGGEEFSFWRYRFPAPGVYEYFDTNMGEPGRKIVDSYYGTVSFIGESNAPKAVVCVDPPACVASAECRDGVAPEGANCCACIGVCCVTDANCGGGRTCLRGRCVDRETGE